ncbi:unnamed protein product [Prunus armeniaca]|uniref:Uncharacterized protein n=1 Tax=Prunus armeniaca TaxID=36596 RepID=A0A6J5WS12_PRUAR|nr:unnamed protein product [Prunus armeniaca]
MTKVNSCAMAIKAQEAAVATEAVTLTPTHKRRPSQLKRSRSSQRYTMPLPSNYPQIAQFHGFFQTNLGGERPFIRTKVNPCALAIKAQEAAVATEEAKLTPAPKYRGTTTVVSSFG